MRDKEIDLEVRIAGFGGQGVLLLGEVLAEAGLDAGLEVSWLPSYGPEMRSGTSNCHVRLSRQTIDSPLVTAPNLLVAMNEPSLRKFEKSVRSGGWIIYNGDEFPVDCAREGVHVLAAPFTQLADELGDKRAANMVMLGALLEIAGALPQVSIDAALLIKFLIIILFYRIGNGVKKYPSKQYSGEHTDNDGYGESCASTTSRAMAMRAPRTPAMAMTSVEHVTSSLLMTVRRAHAAIG